MITTVFNKTLPFEHPWIMLLLNMHKIFNFPRRWYNHECILGINGFKQPEDLVPYARRIREYCELSLQECLSARNGKELIEHMDNISNNLCSIMDLAYCIRAIHPNLHYRRVCWKLLSYLQPVLMQMNSHQDLYARLTELDLDNDEELLAIKRSFIRDFEFYGMKLNNANKSRDAVRKAEYLERVFNGTSRSEPASLHTSSKEQLDALDKLLRARHEVAILSGHCDYSEMILNDRSFISADKVMSGLKELAKHCQSGDDANMHAPGELKLATFNIGQVLEAFAGMCKDLFGLTVKSEPCLFTWAPGMQKLTILKNNNQEAGAIYLDLKYRESKIPSATHFTLRSSKENSLNILYNLDDQKQTSISLISCAVHNLDAIHFQAIATIFHEFGHALHATLSETKYQTLSGTRCSMEVAEFPSLIFERLFETYFHRYFNAEPQKIAQLGEYNSVMGPIRRWEFSQSVHISAIDILLHSTIPYGHGVGWMDDPLERAFKEIGIFKYDPSCKPQGRYFHLGPYGCGFYTYPFNYMMADAYMSNFDTPFSIGQSIHKLLKRGGLLNFSELQHTGVSI